MKATLYTYGFVALDLSLAWLASALFGADFLSVLVGFALFSANRALAKQVAS